MYELKVVKNRTRQFDAIRKRNPHLTDVEAASKFLSSYFKELDREHLVVVCLDAGLKVIGWNLVAIGSLDCVAAQPREVFKPAILSNAHSIVLAHNHPSGNSEPSEGDLRFTEVALQAGRILGIVVHDHLVFGPKDACSIRKYVSEKKPVDNDPAIAIKDISDLMRALGHVGGRKELLP